MKLRMFTVAVAVAALAASAAPASAPAAGSAGALAVVACSTQVYKNGPVYVTSARNMTCNGAKREQARYKWTGKNSFTTPGGYTCRPSGRGKLGFQIRCVKGSKAYRIEFSGG